MKTISQSEFDKKVSHTIRIELQDGHLLLYHVSVESKQAFEKALINENNSGWTFDYIWFYIPKDRIVFVNKKDITRITFCYEPVPANEPEYVDNFSEMEDPDDDLFDTEVLEEFEPEEDSIPQLIIRHHRKKETMQIVKGVTMTKKAYFDNISYYSSLEEGGVRGLEFCYSQHLNEIELHVDPYLQFTDDDGEENFMPMRNLSVIEVERALIMDNDMLKCYLKQAS